ncbi:MAG: NAD(+) diphosphatase [Erysipelotrichaceae bacterium]|nr:NAD(+) diphosphatase [Erysipelotrichaceae bacterium]
MMIQDIEGSFRNEFHQRQPLPTDTVFVFRGRQILLKEQEQLQFPVVEEVRGECQYLFEWEGKNFFLAMQEQEVDGYVFHGIRRLRSHGPREIRFLATTAYHLYTWYSHTRYCGVCATKNVHSQTERAMVCPHCGNVSYPTIAPAVIVGVLHEDKICLTRYANRPYGGRALIAGFCEIGETPEDPVVREVMEEVGLKVKNIRYYKSQPWGFASNLLLGFYADLDGEDTITLDREELARARWVTREEIDEEQDHLSLTREMILAFKNGEIKR